MNYDPIHDTFNNKPETAGDNESRSPPAIAPAIAPAIVPGPAPVPVASLVRMASVAAPASMAHLMSNEAPHDPEPEVSTASSPGPDHAPKDHRKPVSTAIPKGARYLKKSDGEPFWRKDIQYDFMEALFEDKTAVFTNPFPQCSVTSFSNEPKYTFAELYVRTLAESSKCSKILRERLLRDFDMGKSVAKVCLLVNMGRMNTTINFVPEMRSTLRTYHSIPSLQADPSTGGSKQLQDTPRLKSILKAVSDKNEDFESVKSLLENPPALKPNTNLVLLLFVLSNNVNGVKFHHEHTPECYHTANSFMEFFLETEIHPANRAKRFLWLMYTYLETNFTAEELAHNPFNPHEIPPIELINKNELNNFDKDTDYEIEYSERMFRTRLKYLADEEHNSNPKRGNKAKRDKPEERGEEEEAEEEDGGDEDYDEKHKKGKPGSKKRKKTTKPATIASVSKVTNSQSEIDKKGESESEFGLSRFSVDLPSKAIQKIAQLNKHRYATETSNKPDSLLSKTNIQTIINKFRQALKNRKLLSPETDLGLDKLDEWFFRYFQYRKSTHVGLLGMEWENIRYDMIHGLESYLYETEGSELAKIDGTVLDTNPEKDDKEKVAKLKSQHQYKPFYDSDRNNERSQYIYDLLSFCKEAVGPALEAKIDTTANGTKISIDLETEEIRFT